MKGEKMRLGSLIVALLVFCVPTQVIAEAGQKPMAKTEGGSGDDSRREISAPAINKSVAQVCATEINRTISAGVSREIMGGEVKYFLEQACSEADQMRHNIAQNERNAQKNDMDKNGKLAMAVCLQRARLAQCASSAASPPPSGITGANHPPEAPAIADSSKKYYSKAKSLNTQLREAEALAQKHQADVDRKRQGKPKRHVAGAEATKCLTPQTDGGVVNSCPFAVEYSYCVFHPTKDSWSASFDCEKTKGGSWQIGPGPNSRSIMHTAGEATYWFACKYGPTLHKPDGISPADIEFQLGRGLLGRCAEWGAGGSS